MDRNRWQGGKQGMKQLRDFYISVVRICGICIRKTVIDCFGNTNIARTSGALKSNKDRFPDR